MRALNNQKNDEKRLEVTNELKKIIANLTSNEVEEINDNSSLFIELNINEEDFKRIIKDVNKNFDISLNNQELLEHTEVISQLVEEILDEIELG
jgi:division protein CdvB (Snf7/Vps24/ESCRT-III family)